MQGPTLRGAHGVLKEGCLSVKGTKPIIFVRKRRLYSVGRMGVRKHFAGVWLKDSISSELVVNTATPTGQDAKRTVSVFFLNDMLAPFPLAIFFVNAPTLNNEDLPRSYPGTRRRCTCKQLATGSRRKVSQYSLFSPAFLISTRTPGGHHVE